MSVIDRIKSGTTSESDVKDVEIINKYWGISGFFIGMLVTLLIIGTAVALAFRG